MNLANVMDEIGTALETIPHLRVFPYNADRVTPPAVIVDWPEEISYDATFGRGADQQTLKLIVAVARMDARSTRDRLAQYLDGSGAHSVKAAVDSSDTVIYTACDAVRVAKAQVAIVTIGGVDYLGATFDVEITGQGA